jgi:pimeloyl-ACP methyl ester carboxylesterase
MTYRSWLGVAAVALCLALPHPGHAGSTAASIQYDFIDRPAGLPDALHAEAASSLRYLTITAIDGTVNNATLWQPTVKQPADTTMIVMVHGSGSSYSDAPQLALGPNMAARGYAALITNTRQHDKAINTDNFMDIRRDIEAAVATARALGYKKLVIQGHSLGTIQVQYYAANNWDDDIKAVILLAPFGNLPWKSQNILVQNPAEWQKLVDAAEKSLRDGTQSQIMPVKMHYLNGVDSPMTGQHFLTYRYDQTSTADGTTWIRRVPYPILMVRDQSDGIVLPFEPYMLLSAANATGSLVKTIDYKLVPSPKPPNPASHSFVGDETPLADTIAAWLGARGL